MKYNSTQLGTTRQYFIAHSIHACTRSRSRSQSHSLQFFILCINITSHHITSHPLTDDYEINSIFVSANMRVFTVYDTHGFRKNLHFNLLKLINCYARSFACLILFCSWCDMARYSTAQHSTVMINAAFFLLFRCVIRVYFIFFFSSRLQLQYHLFARNPTCLHSFAPAIQLNKHHTKPSSSYFYCSSLATMSLLSLPPARPSKLSENENPNE